MITLGTSEEEQSRTTSFASTLTEQTPTGPQTPTPSDSSTPQRVVLGKRKRGGEDLAQQERHLVQQKEDRAQQDQHLNRTLGEARELEAALRREEIAQAETFLI